MTAISYPHTRQGEERDTHFGTSVPDPYRWLEDDRSPETAAWVAAQNAVTFDYLARIPYRPALRERLASAWNYPREGAPFSEGGVSYCFKNDGLQNQSVLYRQGESGEEIFLDPNGFSQDGTSSLGELGFSRDGRLLAYSVSRGGSDWRTVRIIDTRTRAPVDDPLSDVKFSAISWFGSEGFYYSSYDKPDGSALSAKTDRHKLYFHRLGTPQREDRVVFGAAPDEGHRYVGAQVTEDDRYLLISAAEATSGNRLYLRSLHRPDAPLVTIQASLEADTHLVGSDGDRLFLLTNLNAPNYRLVVAEASNPSPAAWRDLIAEREQVLSVTCGGGYLFAHYLCDAISRVEQFDYQGHWIRDVSLPGPGSVEGFEGKRGETALYYSFTNMVTPTCIYRVDLATGLSTLHRRPATRFNPDDYLSTQVFYRSKDGTRVPMIISHRKGLKLDGKAPSILYGYGGFNVSLTPAFSVAIAVWMEMGGVYAVANLRGGGEYGKAWHEGGIQTRKQNVFDDFIAAAETLITKGYATPDTLAIRGGSNGGLLVGAALTQRPDLFRVAVPAVGVLDMLRYHTFTAGAGWAYDYGTAEQSPEMFAYLKDYSPLHNVRAGVNHPATLITTADHDDRVVPAHSFKFAAELQAKDGGASPQLIRIDVNAGHGAGMPVSMQVDQAADVQSFILWNMGVTRLATA
ncbi:prolyl oligopeptidase family serine peptidase [Aeromonas schubertii]|uniref:prolyl oligopeptidase n=1 Tax=Aeromonas schubertii TaxID=652 RepID=A0ABS7V6R7_9GAMM|nr:prolyl oligopeptidase family serine peptidase [Aeromonas schubertii]MBZ6065072.1 prolyl oligopeptidase family serine peptidase [Aeromonas schubertii]